MFILDLTGGTLRNRWFYGLSYRNFMSLNLLYEIFGVDAVATGCSLLIIGVVFLEEFFEEND